jgi:hypothetical protein
MEQPTKATSRTDSVMITARTTVRMLAARRRAPALTADLADLLHSLANALFDPYQPERHYMRGPGPKWHAKHDPRRASDAIAIPTVIRCA